MEKWKPIHKCWKGIDYEGVYEVSNTGKIKRDGRIFKRSNYCGYNQVSLWKNNKKKTYRVHRLVSWLHGDLQKFPDLCVLHRDETLDPEGYLNNHIDNLWLGTKKENSQDMKKKNRHIATGAGKFGKLHPRSKAIYKCDLEGNILEEYEGLMDANRKTGIDFRYISNAANGRYKTSHGFIWKFKNNDNGKTTD